jgi:hypothetical protein
MGVKRRTKEMKFKHENRTAHLLVRLAKALDIEVRPGWKTQLGEKLHTTPSCISNWVEKDLPSWKCLVEAVSEYNLPGDILFNGHDEGEDPGDRTLTKVATEKWPALRKLVTEVNVAGETGDTQLVLAMIQYVSERIKREDIKD